MLETSEYSDNTIANKVDGQIAMSGNGDSNNETTQARSSGYIRDFLFGSNG